MNFLETQNSAGMGGSAQTQGRSSAPGLSTQHPPRETRCGSEQGPPLQTGARAACSMPPSVTWQRLPSLVPTGRPRPNASSPGPGSVDDSAGPESQLQVSFPGGGRAWAGWGLSGRLHRRGGLGGGLLGGLQGGPPQMEQAGGGAGRRDVDSRAGERPLLSSQTPKMLWASAHHPSEYTPYGVEWSQR